MTSKLTHNLGYIIPSSANSIKQRKKLKYEDNNYLQKTYHQGRSLSRCNPCGCIGPRASGGPAPWWLDRLFSFARYPLRTRIVERLKNLIISKSLPCVNERLISPVIESYQTCSILMLSVISALHHVSLFMDRIWLLLE